MQNRLKTLYENKITNLTKENLNFENYDGPLLISVTDDYINSEKKILFYGQEANGWFGYINTDVDDGLQKYKDFDLCENGKLTTIWNYMYDFKNILFPNSVGKKNFTWNNLSKFSTYDGKTLNENDYENLNKSFDVLKEEFKILGPDIVIFFTGSKWDNRIKKIFDENIKFNKLDENIEINFLAKLNSEFLPTQSYRVSHPRYMQLNKQWSLMEKIIEDIKTA